MTVPEKIWAIPYEGSPDTGRFFPARLAGTTEYTRADIAALDRDAIWNEAIEAAALKMEELAGDWKREKQIAYAHALFIEAKAIRALKRQQGGNEA